MHSDNSPFPLEPTSLRPRDSIKSEGGEREHDKGLIPYTVSGGVFRRGKGEFARSLPRGIMPASAPISVTAHLRYFATSRPAIQLSREQRQAAAADPTLEWDASIHGYRRKRRT